jgi:hypothetical protein
MLPLNSCITQKNFSATKITVMTVGTVGTARTKYFFFLAAKKYY